MGADFRLLPKPDAAVPAADATAHLGRHELLTDLTREELDKRSVAISRDARLALEESGVNTLFIALGSLSWFEADSSDQERLAPLILVPVELNRQTVRDPFQVRRVDEETRINITLLEKLNKEFSIVIPELADEIPTDDAGVDVPLILSLFRDAVSAMPRWAVQETATIGHFSFTKFLMWNDLEQGAESLLENDVIRHLATGGTAVFPDQGPFPSAERLDEERHPKDTFCPLDADSTQLAAVFAAQEGRSLVLEGPPGTGKSQTITNLICQCIGQGQTVLFVSEKKAALDVVHRRLEAVGIGDFCLELHSNKARKKDVLETLGRSWNASSAQVPSDWDHDAARLENVRLSLNGYAAALHERRPLGYSAYEAISHLISLRDEQRVHVEFGPREQLTRDRLQELRDTAARLQAAAEALSSVGAHPWRMVGSTHWTPALQDEVQRTLEIYSNAVAALEGAVPLCAKVLEADTYPMTLNGLRGQAEVAAALLEAPRLPAPLLNPPEWLASRAEVEEWVSHGRARDALEADLGRQYDTRALLALELRQLLEKFSRWSTAFFLFAFFALFFARRQIRRVLKPGAGLPSNTEVTGQIDRGVKLEEELGYLQSIEARAVKKLGGQWREASAKREWERVETLLGAVDRLLKAVSRFVALRSLVDQDDALRTRLARLAQEESPLHEPDGAARQALQVYVDAFKTYDAVRVQVERLLSINPADAWGDAASDAHLDRVRDRLQAWLGALPALREWCHYTAMRQDAERMGMRGLVLTLEEGQLGASRIKTALERAFFEWWLNAVVEIDPRLRDFHGVQHNRLIGEFRDLDRQVRDLTREVVRARLAARMPDPTAAAVNSSEMGILMRELQKKSRHLPVRKLFKKIPQLLRRLKPCFLMSPLSVAQYLGTDYSRFDLVVFDEASQIPTHEAIGAMGRARQVIVVGDTKQLPPTTFFMRMESDEALPDEDDIEELESILDECRAAGVPPLRLGWHYRSRHESLIAFSNYHYYENGLHTFPSATATACARRSYVALVGNCTASGLRIGGTTPRAS